MWLISTRSCRLILVALLPAILLFAGCGGSTTEFVGTWTNPDYTQAKDVDDVLVVAVSDSDSGRRMYEGSLVSALQKQGVTAYPSTQFHPAMDQLSEDQIKKIIEENGIEAAIVTRLLGVDKQDVYVPSTTTVSGYPGYGSPYYGSMYGYYSYGYSVYTSPGYTYTNTTVTLETNLYDASNGELIWSGQSDTFNPDNTQDVIGPTTQLVVNELVALQLLTPKSK